MSKQQKRIDLTQDVIDTLAIQAIKAGNKNFKNHAEKILIEAARMEQSKKNN